MKNRVLLAILIFFMVLSSPLLVNAKSIEEEESSKEAVVTELEGQLKEQEGKLSETSVKIFSLDTEIGKMRLEKEKKKPDWKPYLPAGVLRDDKVGESRFLVPFPNLISGTPPIEIKENKRMVEDNILRNMELDRVSKVRQQEMLKTSIATLKERISKAKEEVDDVSKFLYPTTGIESSQFGWREDPFGGSTGSVHYGLDIAGSGEVWATNCGIVIGTGYGDGTGNYVAVDHGNFNGVHLVSKYFHLSEILVSEGQEVSKGDLLGIQGTTGNSTGVHLHFQVEEDGVPVDPKNYIK